MIVIKGVEVVSAQSVALDPADGSNLESTSVDLLVVGSGNSGLAAALFAYELGIKHVLVIEKSDQYGGTSATSGGMVWVPCNRCALEAGVHDGFEEAREYLQQSLPAGEVPQEMIDTYVREASRMIDFLHERTRARYRTLACLPGASGYLHTMFVRSMEPEPVYRSVLGSEGDRLRDSHRLHTIFDRIGMTAVETLTLLARLPGWRSVLARLLWNYVSDVPWVLTHRRSRRLACGAAGIARLRWSMLDRGMPLWLNSPLKNLMTDELGGVVGATVVREQRHMVVRSRCGVVLAAGGFEHNQAMRERFLPKPTSFEWSAAAGTNTGDALRAALAIGATTRLMNGGYWCSTFKVPDNPVPWLVRIEKSYAGSCVVNRRGVRIANESQDSMTYQRELFAKHSEADPQVPAWLIFDARFRRSYLVGPLYNARLRPDWMLPKLYFSCGFLTRAGTMHELARRAGIDPAGLDRTIATMNEYAHTGKDLEFGRGETEYDRCFGDPRVKPNPCLAPISEPPFYAIRIEPGDFGTQGGLATDANARVLGSGGEPIRGLYAVGNCAAPVCPTYPTGGCTLGPAMTFAWQAAQHIARMGAAQTTEIDSRSD
jgi:3-oxosteroid 1-dehydrogenase